MGPISLQSYDEVRPWAKSIGKAVQSGVMPPWHANRAVGDFRNDRSLSDDQIDTILRWANGGAPEGDPADLPEPRTFLDDEWILGEPDFVVQLEEVEVPAGDPNHEVRASYKFWQSGRIMGLILHMHYRDKDFTYTAHYPDGRSEVLLSVPRYDFNWQTKCEILEPIAIPAGTTIETVSHYDNSADNLENPDPTRDVTFGLESFDEMHIGFSAKVEADQGQVIPLTGTLAEGGATETNLGETPFNGALVGVAAAASGL